MSSSFFTYRGSVRCFLRARIPCGCAALLAAMTFTAAGAKAQSPSQDVAEAARQQKARKAAAQSQRHSHVYSNDDLQKAQIVLPESGAGVEARAKDSGVVPPAVSAAQSPAVNAVGNIVGTESLGEVARRYRHDKAARQIERAGKVPGASPFRMELPQATLAEISPRHMVVQPPGVVTTKNGNVGVNNAGVKRDPFSRPAVGGVELRNEAPNVVATKPSSPAKPRAVGSDAPANASVAQRPPQSLPVVAPGASGTVTIQAGDSLWSLSRRYSGRGARWREWLVSNPGLDSPRRLRAGTTLLLPQFERPRRIVADSGDGGQTIAVRSGDSLWKISADRYGNGAHWRCIARANPELLDERMIHSGQMLRLPAACGEGSSPGVIGN